MNIKRKIEIVNSAILSISEHRDEDTALRIAALDKCSKMIETEKKKIEKEIEDEKNSLDEKSKSEDLEESAAE
jgi:hypothetical protein